MARLIDRVLGHASTWDRLRAAVTIGHLPHALAFTGPAGVGKRKVAWALAQALLCEAAPADRPCGACGSCRRVESGQSEAVLIIEPEKNQIKLDAAREVLAFLSLRRVSAARVVIVNDAQTMNPQTANACLKVVEEPPPGTHFILITPEISQLLPTLRSRSQVLRFGPLEEADLARGAGTDGGEPPEPWMLRAARGSFERLATYRDADVVALREIALSYLRDALGGKRAGLDTVMSGTKDRERTLTTIQFLQVHLRDWSVGQLSLDDRSATERVELWRRAHRMETDFHAHVDRGLIFQNFYNHVASSRTTAGGRA